MSRITPVQVAMGVGVSGAMVDVSTYVSYLGGIAQTWGRQDEFRDAAPRAFSFTLDNYDGRFTPGNLSSAWPTPVTEGMPVSWMLGTRLVSGTVLGAILGADEPTWGTITISCDDFLGNASRNQVTLSLADSLTTASTQLLLWRLDSAVSSTTSVEASAGTFGPLTLTGTQGSTFGQTATVGLPGTQLALAGTTAGADTLTATATQAQSFTYTTASMGFWGFWVTATAAASATVSVSFQSLTSPILFGLTGSSFFITAGTAAPVTVPAQLGAAHYVSIGIGTTYAASAWTITVTLYIDGVAVATSTYTSASAVSSLANADRQPTAVTVSGAASPAAATSALIARLSHTLSLVREDLALVMTEAGRLTALAAASPEIVLATLPADLSTAPIGPSATGSVLDGFNAVMRTEQGAIYTTTTGTLLAPTQTINVRARQRPVTPAYTFDCAFDLQGVIPFVRDITNMVAQVSVMGSGQTVAVADPSVTSRVRSANASESVLNTAASDLSLFGQDRINRGKNVNLRATSVTIDALVTTADQSANLLAMVPGDRISIVNIPPASLGFSSWDGWLLGVSELHTIFSHTFTLYLQPVLPNTAIFDTNLFMAGGALTLAAPITAAATTMTVATTGPLLESVAVPYLLVIDSEIVTVTACDTAAPQNVTISRTATTPVGHAIGATVEVSPPSLYPF